MRGHEERPHGYPYIGLVKHTPFDQGFFPLFHAYLPVTLSATLSTASFTVPLA